MYVRCFNYLAFAFHMGLNCYINTGVRDLEVTLIKTYSTSRNDISSKNLRSRPIYAEINTHLRWNSPFYLNFC